MKTSVNGIHPGETVTVTGPPARTARVSAESIRVGAGAAAASAALFGGAGARAPASASGGAGRREPHASEPALFGSG